MFWRDPQDRRYPERLGGSYLASLVFHVLLALTFFSVVANSSNEGASENISGGQLITLQQRAPAVSQLPVPAAQAAPVPHAPRVAPLAHPPLARPAHQQRPPARPELSKVAPTAPPNPTPLPQATAKPNIEPTQAVYEAKPDIQVAAVPTPVPANVTAVTVKMPPTAAPSPAPTTAPTAKPTAKPPVPTALPSARPQTPAPTAPSPAPSAPAITAAASARPSASPAPAAAVATSSPAARQGVPSPSPTRGATVAKAAGTAPSPGPKGTASPGPRAGGPSNAKPGPSRAVNVAPTPSSARSSGSAKSSRGAVDINAKLRALLPHNDVNPSYKSYRQNIGLEGRLEPTPPPEVLAATKFIFEERGTGREARIKMWVTNVRRDGPVTMCEGWLVRYPAAPGVGMILPFGSHVPANNGGSIGGLPGGTLPPIVEAQASTACSERRLVPFAASPAPSP